MSHINKFVNAHTHLELTFDKTFVTENLHKKELWDWIVEVVKIKRLSKEEVFIENIKRGEDYLIANNNLFVGDIRSLLPEGPLLFNQEIDGVVFFEVLGYEEDVFNRKWDDFQKFYNRHRKDGRIGLSIHSLYTTSPKRAKEMIAFAREKNIKVTLHMAEKKEEGEFLFANDIRGFRKIFKSAIVEDYGFKSYSDIIDYLNLGEDTILIHCTQFNIDDWRKVEEKNIPVVLCPRSNLYFTGSLPDLNTIANLNIRWALGTDSLFTNLDINVLEEGRFIIENFSHIKNIEKKVYHALTDGGRAIFEG